MRVPQACASTPTHTPMRLSILPFILSALAFSATLPQPVKIAGGLVEGAPGTDPSVTAYKGLPFAAPPVGNLRWRAPKPVTPWQGVRSAAEFGASCMQNIVDERKPWTYEFMTHTPASEDCLYLNVWTAARSGQERRPVYVYIHGGGNTEGSGAVPVYDGEGLAKKGIVVVTVNYRLGVFGFLTHPELTRESESRSSGNYAILDLIAALQWVRDNIAVFGGDPNRVAVGGQSAGAANTHALTASPLARGLFHRAIAESGSSVGGGPMGTRTLADQEQQGVKWAEAKGARTLADLRAKPAQELLAPVPGTPFRFGTVVDGYVLPASVAEVFAQGRQHDVPTLTGLNMHENGATPNPAVTAEAFAKQAQQRYGEGAAEFLKLYPAATDAEARVAQNESSWDQARVSMYLWATNRGRTARTKAFTYMWDHTLPGPDAGTYGAFHTSEVPYFMNTLAKSKRPFTDADHKVADTMSSYIANFVKTGDPNGAGLPRWPAVSEQPAHTMRVGDLYQPVRVAANDAKLAFFERFFARAAAAQQTARPAAPAARGPQAPAVISPEVLADRRVTFRILAPNAESVRLSGGDIPGNNQGAPMTKGANGVWEVTLGPVPAGAYRYNFNVGGIPVIDPRNPSTSESNNNTWSLVVVPGAEMMDTRAVPHGSVASVTYHSTALARPRRMHIYTPPGYELGKDRYPVFYLLHGAGDSDNSWSSVGRTGFILDNLIAAGKAKPMIVVMPAGHTNQGGFRVPSGSDEFARDFLNDVMPHVEKHYRVLAGRANRALAGLSMGGGQTLTVGIPNLEKFAYIGVFSSGLFNMFATRPGQAPPEGPSWEQQNLKVLDDAALKKGLKLVWFATGKDDFLLNTSRSTVELFKKHGFDVVYKETGGGHTWLNWRDYLIEFAPQLFR